MSDRDELFALAERCEATAKPDNVLNRAIARAVGWGYRTPSEAGRKSPAWFHPDDCRDGKPVLDSLHGTDVWREPSQYVFSIDAAMTLVPEGWFGRVEPRFYSDEGMVRWRAYAIKPDWSKWTPHDDWFEVVGDDQSILAATAALALCAAALRAKAGAA